MVSQPLTACQSFIKSYITHETLSPKRGAPFEISQEDKESVILVILGNPCSSLKDISSDTSISTASVKNILNEEGIFLKFKSLHLTQTHMQKRY